VVYFKQFNARASVILLQQMGVVGDVKSCINQLLTIHHFTALVDLPLWIGLTVYVFRKDLNIKINYRALSVMPVVLAAVLVITPFRAAYSDNLAKREFFSFHVQDIVKAVTDNEDMKIDNVDIAAEINYRNKIYNDPKALAQLKYNSIGKGKNLIVVQLESVQDFVINWKYNDQEITPNLNKLIRDQSLYYDSYYEQLGMGNTSDAEFATNNGIYPTVYGQSYALYTNNTFRGLPWQLRDNGYNAYVFHGYKPEFWNRETAYPTQGFERFYSEKDYTIEESIGFGLNDKEFFTQNVNYLKDSKKPFYSFMITLSNHHPYQMPKQHQNIKLLDKHVGTLFGDYLQSVHYTDEAIGLLIEELKAKGLYENSVIAFYGDHHGLISSDEESKNIMEDVFQKPYLSDEMLHIPLVIHVPGSGVNETVKTIGTQIDFMPTIMNILGIANDNYLIFGKDLNNTPVENSYAAFQIYATYGSFINDKYIFEMSNDYVFENAKAYDRKTYAPVDVNLCLSMYNLVREDFKKAKYVMDNNLIVKATEYKGEQYKPRNEVAAELTPMYIPLDGGRINGAIGTNSLEALMSTYEQDIKVIGLSFDWTEDNNLVAVKNWDVANVLFEEPLSDHSMNGFMMGKMKGDLTQLNIRRVLDWLSAHEESYIVADAGSQGVDFAKYMYDHYDDAKDRFIYKVDSLDEFNKLGYLEIKHIMLDLNKVPNKPEEIINFLRSNMVYGVVVDKELLTPAQIKEIQKYTSVYFVGEEGYKKQ
jgi:phosphoglycerol transferase MdoB-like AlkP superfamily enzyme